MLFFLLWTFQDRKKVLKMAVFIYVFLLFLCFPVGGGVFSVVLIMANPCAEGVFVTGKQADCVLATGWAKLPPPVEEPGLDRDLALCPMPEGVIAVVAPAWRRPCVESPANKYYISNA